MIYDISQELLSCSVYPGDPKPTLIPLKRMADGALYNLSSLSMCVHNGTHIDAPAHRYAYRCAHTWRVRTDCKAPHPPSVSAV